MVDSKASKIIGENLSKARIQNTTVKNLENAVRDLLDEMLELQKTIIENNENQEMEVNDLETRLVLESLIYSKPNFQI